MSHNFLIVLWVAGMTRLRYIETEKGGRQGPALSGYRPAHKVFCWDSLHHNTIGEIKNTVNMIHDSLINGGLFIVSLLSTKSGQYVNSNGLLEP